MIPNVQSSFGKYAAGTLFFCCLLAMPTHAWAADPLRVLFLGNSYTSQIKATVQGIVSESPQKAAVLEFICPGGKTLEYHSTQQSTLDRIRDGKWDVVVLQDQSQTPAVFPKQFLAASKRLHAVIQASGADTAYYQTWGRRDGDKKNAKRFSTYVGMQKALSKAYHDAARRDAAILVPVGEAWQATRKLDPDLGRDLYRKDGSHPSANGAYLAGLCFYCRVLKGDLKDVKYSGEVDAKAEATLRQAVGQVIKD